jgi:hypothetical protein
MRRATAAHTKPSSPAPFDMLHLEHIDVNEITAHVGRETEVLLGLLRLAVKVGREQLESFKEYAELGDVAGCRFAIHSLLNTFNFLHANEAMRLATELETQMLETSNLIPAAGVERLCEAWSKVEQDLISFIRFHN